MCQSSSHLADIFASDDVRKCRPLQLSLARSNLHGAWGHGITPKQTYNRNLVLGGARSFLLLSRKAVNPHAQLFTEDGALPNKLH